MAEWFALFAFLVVIVILGGLFVAEIAYRLFTRPLDNPVPDERESSIEDRRRKAGE